MTKTAAVSIIILLAISQTGCKLFRLDVRQGNSLTQKNVDLLTTKDSKLRVQDLLGTPNITASYEDRLDYFYSLQPSQDKVTELQYLTIYFTNNTIKCFDGNIIPKNIPRCQKQSR